MEKRKAKKKAVIDQSKECESNGVFESSKKMQTRNLAALIRQINGESLPSVLHQFPTPRFFFPTPFFLSLQILSLSWEFQPKFNVYC